MMEIIKAIILGIVQGLTEFLPVSSSGHLIFFKKIFGLEGESFGLTFDIALHIATLVAVVVVLWKEIVPLLKKPFQKYVYLLVVATIPAGIIGILFDDILDALFYRYEVVAIALIVFGVAFIVIENRNKGKDSKINSLAEITYQTALWIGVFQEIAAVFSGTSRSGATIIGALLIGVSRTVAAEYTFFLAIPVMFGASLLKLLKFGFDFAPIELTCLLVGCVVAFAVSVFVLKFLLAYIKKHDFKVFGWYRIVLGIVVLVAFGLFL